jgi:hypothetical protein
MTDLLFVDFDSKISGQLFSFRLSGAVASIGHEDGWYPKFALNQNFKKTKIKKI